MMGGKACAKKRRQTERAGLTDVIVQLFTTLVCGMAHLWRKEIETPSCFSYAKVECKLNL